ncbi:MAG: hypothetical protein ACTHKF_11010 [Candidatus Nitrosocosmicus sp.]
MAIHIIERLLLAYRFFKKEKECKEEEQDDYKCTQRGGVYYRAMYPLSSLLPLHSFSYDNTLWLFLWVRCNSTDTK